MVGMTPSSGGKIQHKPEFHQAHFIALFVLRRSDLICLSWVTKQAMVPLRAVTVPVFCYKSKRCLATLLWLDFLYEITWSIWEEFVAFMTLLLICGLDGSRF